MKQENDIAQKHAGGPPQGSHNARKTGFYPAKAAVSFFGKRVINRRTRSGREWNAIYKTFLAEAVHMDAALLQREDEVKKAEKTLSKVDVVDIQALASEAWLIRRLDAAILGMHSITRRDKTLIPIIAERDARQASYEKRRAEFRRRFAKTPEWKPWEELQKRSHEAASHDKPVFEPEQRKS